MLKNNYLNLRLVCKIEFNEFHTSKTSTSNLTSGSLTPPILVFMLDIVVLPGLDDARCEGSGGTLRHVKETGLDMSTKSVNCEEFGKGAVLLEGYLKKLKTMKKKYFIVRGECHETAARLEYYDSEKKYRLGQPPKRTIGLKACFNINLRKDTKHKHVIALYTKDDVFCIVMENEQQQEEWLRTLLQLQSGADNIRGDRLRPNFEHVWKVKLQDKGLGDSKNLVGLYYLCLSDQMLSLIKISNRDITKDVLEFPLTQIRSCGCSDSYFYVEVGRQSVTGAGELWMLTADPYIAKNMNAVVLNAFTLRQRDYREKEQLLNIDPHRKRSASATEENRPAAFFTQRRLTATASGTRPFHANLYTAVPVASSLAATYSRAQRTSSQRRHSVSAMSSSSMLVSHAATGPLTRFELSAPFIVASSNSDLPPVSHQRTNSCPVSQSASSPIPIIVEPHRVLSQNHVGGPVESSSSSTSSRRTSVNARRGVTGKSSTSLSDKDGGSSRNRTSSEGHHKVYPRPQSVHVRGVSYSPPGGGLGPCSTDSAGSSLSIDEPDFSFHHSSTIVPHDEQVILEENCDDVPQWTNDPDEDTERHDTYVPMSRPPPSLSLPIKMGPRKKPGLPSYLHGQSPSSGGSPSDYMPMSPADCSRHVTTTSTNYSPSSSDYMPMSPGDSASFKRSSPASSSDYMPMSPISGSRRVPDYMPMPILSPQGKSTSIAAHNNGNGNSESLEDYLPMSPPSVDGQKRRVPSHGSSLADDDGYVPMAPATDDGYVDMDPVSNLRFISDGGMNASSPGSSCSMTSGTPSTDHYLLDKVSSYFTPSEEEEPSCSDQRSIRTHSFGSSQQPAAEAAAARVRAFSVGTRPARTPRELLHKLPLRAHAHAHAHSVKFCSAPTLPLGGVGANTNTWNGNARVPAPHHDPMADHMELDFTKNRGLTSSSGRSRVPTVMETSSSSQANSSADSGYMDMSASSKCSPPKTTYSHYNDIRNTANRQKPVPISSAALKTIGEKPHGRSQKFPTTSSVERFPDANRSKKVIRDGSIETEGYMDMSFGASAAKLTRKSSADNVVAGVNVGDDDYVPMSGGKSTSQPIAIIPSCTTPSVTSSSAMSKLPNILLGGSSFNPFASLRRNARRKNSSKKLLERRNSKENAPDAPLSPTKQTIASPLSCETTAATVILTEKADLLQDAAAEPESSNLAVPLNRVLRICSKENSPAAPEADDNGEYAFMRPNAPTVVRWGPSGVPTQTTPPITESAPSLVPMASTDVPISINTHDGVTRQVSTSSSSSTEVSSVKECFERAITYASLDLGCEEPKSPRPSPTLNQNLTCSPSPVQPSMGNNNNSSSNMSQSPVPTSDATAFTYAEIDFERSESLRASSNPPKSVPNKKIRH